MDINDFCNFCGNELEYIRYMGSKLKHPQIKKACRACGMIKSMNYKYSLFEDINKLDILDYSDKEVYRKTLYSKIESMNNLESKVYYNNVYLKSKEWRRKRNLIFKRDNGICRFCKKDGSDVHHITYDNLMRESWMQLITLCRDCHLKVHSKNEYKVNGIVVNYGILKFCGRKIAKSCKTYHNGHDIMCIDCRNELDSNLKKWKEITN